MQLNSFILLFKRSSINCYASPLALRKTSKCHQLSWCRNFVEMHNFRRVLGICPKLCGNCKFLHMRFHKYFRTRKLGTITVFYEMNKTIGKAKKIQVQNKNECDLCTILSLMHSLVSNTKENRVRTQTMSVKIDYNFFHSTKNNRS